MMIGADDDEYSSPMPLKSEIYKDDADDGSDHDGDAGAASDVSEPMQEPSRRPRRFRVLRPRGDARPRFAFRRRRERDGDHTFWNFVLLLSFLSLAVLIAIAIFLAQTDFFVEHQVDLLGTYVDEHFTVVSTETASVYLKNNGHAPATASIALEDGAIRIGQYKQIPSDDANEDDHEPRFHGVEVSGNGTVTYSNGLVAPSVQATTVHASNVIFTDGTTMTTAAGVSGGLVQAGDLNFASQKGAIVASTSGQQRLRVNADGAVCFPNSDAVPPEDPSALGITIDGRHGRIALGAHLVLHADKTTAGLQATTPLTLEAQELVLGRDGASSVRVMPRTSSSKIRLELVGQSAADAGGDVLVSGGPGAVGGTITIQGGAGSARALGHVAINTDEHVTTATSIGSNQPDSHVKLSGVLELNSASKELPTSIGGTVTVAGASFEVGSKTMHLGHAKTTTELAVAASVITMTSVKALNVTAETLRLRAVSVALGAASTLTLDATTQLQMTAGTLKLQATEMHINSPASSSSVEIHGSIALGANAGFRKHVNQTMVALGGSSVLVGDPTGTSYVSLAAAQSISLTVNGSALAIASGPNKMVALAAPAGMTLGVPDAPAMMLASKAVHIQANQIQIGDASLSTQVHLDGTIFVNGVEWSARRRLDAETSSALLLWQSTSGSMTVDIRTRQEFRLAFTWYMDHTMQAPAPFADSAFVVTHPSPSSTPHVELAMSVHGLRALATSAITTPLLLRCRLVQTSFDAMGRRAKVLLEASTEVDVCSGDDATDHTLWASTQYTLTCALRFKRPHAALDASLSLHYDRAEVTVRSL
ncbi:hypothetical protein SPRG_11342 [Saprolegnia parasitica CBS 223.65]|uniref:Uncharacterized protein n=1 Tax=Saprolegnia parasitica (strain CBS 223.65) TaxID=695850 RepID=A0A067BZV6_SAPPC|nr:hypothetical protein SPRG_11342 [Saprolegnia parasitica CBS 223.65]KDO22390.1 hypothetical protein SPRG_11342 [Saprolegnia parasitica CBS 223.65]|eukprot:XP_012206913.1 hypothetical protein SPRG_11342 [Saprolegnia parasitica CBS 223.65]